MNGWHAVITWLPSVLRVVRSDVLVNVVRNVADAKAENGLLDRLEAVDVASVDARVHWRLIERQLPNTFVELPFGIEEWQERPAVGHEPVGIFLIRLWNLNFDDEVAAWVRLDALQQIRLVDDEGVVDLIGRISYSFRSPRDNRIENRLSHFVNREHKSCGLEEFEHL